MKKVDADSGSSAPVRRSIVFRVLRIAILAYLGLVVFMAGCQRSYIYYPQRASEEVLLKEGSEMGLEPWRTSGGDLIGWTSPGFGGKGPARQVIVFHGNAGMAIHRSYYGSAFQWMDNRWDVRIFEYPGYGFREGEVGEEAFYEAAREAMASLESGEEDTLLLLGESLGSGVACRMAAEFPEMVDGLILVTPFTNLADVGKHHFPYIPVGFLLRDRYDNEGALENYDGPLAMVLAEGDDVIPAEIGQRLYDGYEGPKQIWVQEGRNHNTLDLGPGAQSWAEILDFLKAER